MRLLLPVAAALGGGALAVLLAGAAPQATRRRRGVPVEAPIVLATLAGLVTHAALTGNLGVDLVLGGGVAALSAWAGARVAHRFFAAFALALTALLGFSAVAAAGAGVAVAVVLLRSRLPPLKAVAGGLLGIGLLTEVGQLGPTWRELLALLAVVFLAGSAARRNSPEARRTFAIALSAGLLLVAVAAAGFLVFAIPAARDLERAVQLSEGATRVLTSERGEDAAASLALAASSFGQAHDRLKRWPARLVDGVPFVAQNAAALRALAGAGEQVASAAGAVTVSPSELKLVDGTIDFGVIDEAGRGIRAARLSVVGAISELAATRSRSLLPPVADASDDLGERLREAAPTLVMLEQALDQLPAMLGRDQPRRYFLALQTPSESRAAGGIIGAFGLLEADQGRLALTRTGDAIALNAGGDPAARSVSDEDEFLARYGRFLPLQNWQNLSLSPDWPTVGRVAAQLFPQSGGQPIDGVIGLDPFALSALLSATGPIAVPPWPVPLSAENAESVLLHEQYLFFPNPERKEFLGDVTGAVFNRLTGEGISLRALATSLAPAVASRNVQMWAAEPEEQDLLDAVSATGAFPSGHEASDLLAVVNQNSSGNKIDWFLHRKTSYDLTFDPMLGRVEARARIELRNDAPSRGLPDYVIGSAGPRESRTAPGENRTWVSVYTPLELRAALLDGRPFEMEQADELGHGVYSAFVTIPPGGTLALELDLAGPVDPDGSSYRLHLRRQVLPNPETVTVSVRFADGWEASGATREEFELTRDRRIEFGFRPAND